MIRMQNESKNADVISCLSRGRLHQDPDRSGQDEHVESWFLRTNSSRAVRTDILRKQVGDDDVFVRFSGLLTPREPSVRYGGLWWHVRTL